MNRNRNKLYLLLLFACVFGYIWFFFRLSQSDHSWVNACFIKQLTGLPCPSCGSTRSVMSLVKGHFSEALKTNPLGYVIAVIMVLAPLWIAFDVATQRQSLYDFYKRLEIRIRKPQCAIPLVILIILNWIWNILKGL